MNMKNNILAIPAAPAAIPPNPKKAAMIANIINVIVQRNIIIVLRLITKRDFLLIVHYKVP